MMLYSGLIDVTAKVRSLRKAQKLSFTVSNHTFGGDPWPGHRKSCVAVYKYSNSNSQPETIIVEEDKLLEVDPPSDSSPYSENPSKNQPSASVTSKADNCQ